MARMTELEKMMLEADRVAQQNGHDLSTWSRFKNQDGYRSADAICFDCGGSAMVSLNGRSWQLDRPCVKIEGIPVPRAYHRR